MTQLLFKKNLWVFDFSLVESTTDQLVQDNVDENDMAASVFRQSSLSLDVRITAINT